MENKPQVVFVGSQSEFDNAAIVQEASKWDMPAPATQTEQDFVGMEDFCQGVVVNIAASRATRGRLLGGR